VLGDFRFLGRLGELEILCGDSARHGERGRKQ
jgi:hypothetical protein